MRAWFLSPAMIALWACATPPSYQPPPQPVPATWRDSAVVRTASVAEAPWWRIYRDTTLERLVRTALAQNIDLGIALERVTEARALLAQARGARLPAVAASAAVHRGRSRETQSGESYSYPSNYYSAQLEARWELDVFGVQREYARGAAASLQVSEEQRRGVALLVVAAVASAYVELQATDQELQVTDSALQRRRGYLETTRRRFDGAPSAELDFRQAQVLYEAARETSIDLREAAVDAENALSTLLGRAPGPVPRSGAPGDQLLAAVPAGLPSSLVTRRPDVRAAERGLAAAGALVGSARALLLPQLSLSGGLQWFRRPGYTTTIQGNPYGTPTSTTTGWYAAASIDQPVFEGGRLVSQLRAVESRRRQALLAYEGTVLGALQEVEGQLAALRLGADRRASADSQAVYAAAALKAAEDRYAAGTSPFLEVVDAQRTHLDAQLGAVAARVRQADAVIGLYKALGGGWQEDSTAAAGGPPR